MDSPRQYIKRLKLDIEVEEDLIRYATDRMKSVTKTEEKSIWAKKLRSHEELLQDFRLKLSIAQKNFGIA